MRFNVKRSQYKIGVMFFAAVLAMGLASCSEQDPDVYGDEIPAEGSTPDYGTIPTCEAVAGQPIPVSGCLGTDGVLVTTTTAPLPGATASTQTTSKP